MNNSDEFRREGLSVFEACAVAGIGRTKLYEAIATGALVARKFGKRRIILRDDLRQFLNSLPVVKSESTKAASANSWGTA
jgi:excisionase family DNA binding protein